MKQKERKKERKKEEEEKEGEKLMYKKKNDRGPATDLLGQNMC